MQKAVWDDNTQTFHGGQDWKFLSNYVADFSVTTNGIGTPESGLLAAREAVDSIHHYPPADFQPALHDLAEFVWPTKGHENMSLMQLGNGASELIDLVIRSVRPGGWRPGGTLTQYKEYERASEANGRATLSHDDPHAVLTCIVNPTNPTGDYLTIDAMKQYIETTCPNHHTVIVDESMQPWVGPAWRSDSLLHQREWVMKLCQERQIDVWVMTSWTKIWSCTGIRIGSVVGPTPTHIQNIKKHQVPWSVNSMALAFISAVVKDDAYMQRTWHITPLWHKNLVDALHARWPTWTVHGQAFLSWVWVNTHSERMADQAVQQAKAAGVPIRSGRPGYNLPTYIRIAVRNATSTNVLIEALSNIE